MKSVGKAEIKHYPPIPDADLQKLYASMYFSTDTPVGLYNKVKFDVRYYFCRRASENMRSMTKASFNINTDPDTNRRYVTKTENCPVSSFTKYISKASLIQHKIDYGTTQKIPTTQRMIIGTLITP